MYLNGFGPAAHADDVESHLCSFHNIDSLVDAMLIFGHGWTLDYQNLAGETRGHLVQNSYSLEKWFLEWKASRVLLDPHLLQLCDQFFSAVSELGDHSALTFGWNSQGCNGDRGGLLVDFDELAQGDDSCSETWRFEIFHGDGLRDIEYDDNGTHGVY